MNKLVNLSVNNDWYELTFVLYGIILFIKKNNPLMLIQPAMIQASLTENNDSDSKLS